MTQKNNYDDYLMKLDLENGVRLFEKGETGKAGLIFHRYFINALPKLWLNDNDHKKLSNMYYQDAKKWLKKYNNRKKK